MVAVNLKGVHKVTTKIKGKTYTYYYAWRGAGAPRLQGKPGSTEFINSFNEAIAELKTPDTDRFRSLVALYRSSNDYKELADSTKRNWGPWLDKIADYFGFMRIGAFDKTEKIRPRIRQWRGQWANQPRTADYGIQVLSRVCSYGVDPLGKLASNPCDGIKHLYKGDRSEIIWTDPTSPNSRPPPPRRSAGRSTWPR